VEQHKVIAYDIDAGLVTRYATDDRGNVMLSRSAGEWMTEEACGEVVVILKPV
jgi:hypothetical protein